MPECCSRAGIVAHCLSNVFQFSRFSYSFRVFTRLEACVYRASFVALLLSRIARETFLTKSEHGSMMTVMTLMIAMTMTTTTTTTTTMTMTMIEMLETSVFTSGVIWPNLQLKFIRTVWFDPASAAKRDTFLKSNKRFFVNERSIKNFVTHQTKL